MKSRTNFSLGLLVLFALVFANPITTPSAEAVLEPPSGTGCQKCDDAVYFLGDEVIVIENVCVTAEFAAPISGRICHSGGGECYVEDFCQYA